jgi:hypothetical protein
MFKRHSFGRGQNRVPSEYKAPLLQPDRGFIWWHILGKTGWMESQRITRSRPAQDNTEQRGHLAMSWLGFDWRFQCLRFTEQQNTNVLTVSDSIFTSLERFGVKSNRKDNRRTREYNLQAYKVGSSGELKLDFRHSVCHTQDACSAEQWTHQQRQTFLFENKSLRWRISNTYTYMHWRHACSKLPELVSLHSTSLRHTFVFFYWGHFVDFSVS